MEIPDWEALRIVFIAYQLPGLPFSLHGTARPSMHIDQTGTLDVVIVSSPRFSGVRIGLSRGSEIVRLVLGS